ncbi:hypothetical protein BJ912DRAFT_1058035 [Pholiota molesta]|nr:hypothetical protein BJ912DRAFT_1058035 [Pholiota molesta]
MPQELNNKSDVPHVFHNFPYLKTHPDPTLVGKTPIPTSHTDMPVMYEYPIM